MLVLLVGPKGAGKSYVGRLLESALKVHFLHVEPLWMSYYAECDRLNQPRSILEGIKRVRPAIDLALQAHEHVCIETTGASAEIFDDLVAAGAASGVLLVKIHAPLSTCLERIETRNPTHQIPVDVDTIRKIYELGSARGCQFDLTIENVSLSDREIAEAFAPFLGRGDAA
jgi:predicted ABC-type ATPase